MVKVCTDNYSQENNEKYLEYFRVNWIISKCREYEKYNK